MGKTSKKEAPQGQTSVGELMVAIEKEKAVIDKLSADSDAQINRLNEQVNNLRAQLKDDVKPHNDEISQLAKKIFGQLSKEDDWKAVASSLGVEGEEFRFSSGVIQRTWLAPEIKIADKARALLFAIKKRLSRFVRRRVVERSLNVDEMLKDKATACTLPGVSFERKRVLKIRLNTQVLVEKPIRSKTIASEEVRG